MMAGCSHVATVPNVSGAELAAVGAQQQGRFKAVVQTGGWNMKVSSTTFQCGAHSFDTNINGSWEQGMRQALTAGLEHVDYSGATPKTEELIEGKYSASIVVSQLNASSTFTVIPEFFTASATSSTDLQSVIVITWPNGQSQQNMVAGHGTAKGSAGLACGSIGDTVGQSSAEALKDLIRQTVVTIKLLLAQNNNKT